MRRAAGRAGRALAAPARRRAAPRRRPGVAPVAATGRARIYSVGRPQLRGARRLDAPSGDARQVKLVLAGRRAPCWRSRPPRCAGAGAAGLPGRRPRRRWGAAPPALTGVRRHPTTLRRQAGRGPGGRPGRLARLGLGRLRRRRAVPGLPSPAAPRSSRETLEACSAAGGERPAGRRRREPAPRVAAGPSWSARTATGATTAWCSSPSSCRCRPASGPARRPPQVARKMGLDQVHVAAMETAAEGYTFFVVYGRTDAVGGLRAPSTCPR